VLPNQWMEKIRALHEGPDRGYHAWSHPKALLALLAEVRDRLSDPLAVECAIVLHDAVYDPTRGDNEARSALLAREMLSGIVPDETLERAVRLIEATARHQPPENVTPQEREDACVFLDLDLSILGADDDAFDAYEAGVRHEYRRIPEAAFKEGRAAILKAFLARDRLYLSEWGRARFEAKARENLQRSLRRLTSA
jgi:predicted metal-dependent HD superfamily phosphohydrolase